MLHLPTLLLQIAIVVAVARLFGWLFRRLHQPQVVGEMVAGIALGPSLLGWIAPSLSATLFPPDSLVFLNAVSQIGVLLFMFLIGLELDLSKLRQSGKVAIATSLASVAVPFALGYVAAVFLYPLLSNESVNVFNFAFFIGTALSVTAFPVLARILVERRLLQTRIGMISIASAAVVDVVAWCMLAFVILLARGNGATINLIFTLLGSAVFVCTMFFVVRPLLRKFEKLHGAKQSITQGMLAFVIMLIFSSALITEWLGLHALFGAFLAGVIMPKDEDFIDELSGKLQDITIVLLLPIFFAFTGLKTTIGLLTGANVWGYCLLIIAIAIVGKIGGATFAARFTGLTWREAGAIGILLNTRGLVELIILNIGLEAGILSPTVFAMMVMMALVTTAITTPLLQLVFPTPKASEGEAS